MSIIDKSRNMYPDSINILKSLERLYLPPVTLLSLQPTH